MIKYFKLNLDYKNYNFNDFTEDYNSEIEHKQKGEIEWLIKCQKISVGDVMYIYCKNMPDLRNRFIIRAVVKKILDKNDVKPKYQKDFSPSRDKMLILENIEALDTEDNYTFSIADLKEKYDYSICQGLYSEIFNDKLVKDLENTKRNNVEKFLEKYVNAKCYFEKAPKFRGDSEDYKHSTFRKENGIVYVEYHHFILRYLGKDKAGDFIKDIDCLDNYIELCPTCHKKIHYGKLEVRKQMLDYVIKNCNRPQLEELVNKINHDNKKSFDEYIYDIYNINKKEENE